MENKTLNALQELMEVVAQLRAPSTGCPWDLAQTQTSLIPYIIEESYEVVDAIRHQNQTQIADELGDLLLQVVLQAQIAQDEGYFSLEEVAQNISAKLIRRHPHVFGNVKITDETQIHENWEKIKAEEKASRQESALLSDQLTQYQRSLPPLMASQKIAKKSARAGFEWENIEGVWEKFHEELAEFQEAINNNNQNHAEEELGDIFFSLINLARWYDLDATRALQGTNHRFIQRLAVMENYAQRPLSEYDIMELEALWQKAKQWIIDNG